MYKADLELYVWLIKCDVYVYSLESVAFIYR